MPRIVLSEMAERYVGMVMTTAASGGRPGEQSIRPRIARAVSRSLMPRGDLEYLLLPHITAIVEDFSRQMLIRASEPLVPLEHALLRELWRRGERQAEGAWPEHISAWNKWHGITLNQAPMYDDLMAFIDARNAVMHGLGELTRRQRGTDGGAAVLSKLANAGIRVRGLRIVIDRTTTLSCADVARGFISWLDFQIREGGLIE